MQARRLLPLLLLVISVTPAAAQQDTATVRLYGRSLFRVVAHGGVEAPERARQIERRLNLLLETTGPMARPTIGRTPEGNQTVSVGNAIIVTATQADAEENLTDVETLAARWAAEIETAVAAARPESTTPLNIFLVRVQSAFRSAFGRLGESATQIVPAALAALLVLGLFWGAAALVRAGLHAALDRIINDKTTASLIKQGTYYTVFLLGLFVAAGALGFEPQTVVTGLGLTSLALGFALKDILSNIVSGILLLALRPFELGDQIVVGDTEGNVERIQLRATLIRTYDGRLVYVPNADIFTSRVTNNTATPIRRATIHVPLSYDQDLRLTAETLRRAAQDAPGVLDKPAPFVRVEELGPNEITMAVLFWADSRRLDYAATLSAVRQAAVESLKAAGITVPEPNLRVLAPRSPEQWSSIIQPLPEAAVGPDQYRRRS